MSWWAAGPMVYAAILICLIATGCKLAFYAGMPRHLRWDLYPIPHQGPIGSKYQKQDFHSRKPPIFPRYELMAMLREMVWIQKAFVHNRRLWTGSFPLHIGIYLCAAWVVLLIVGAWAISAGQPVSGWTALLQGLTQVTGAAGLSAGLSGSLYLLRLRLGDQGLRQMSDPVLYAQLGIMILLFGSGLTAWLTVDRSFILIREHIGSLLRLRPAVTHPLIAWEMLIFSLFLLVLPFSRMMHYAAKYFLYHRIMWDDEPIQPGSPLEQNVSSSLHGQVSWSAPHVKRWGNWLEQAAGAREEGDGK
ncbi:hypothetical protein ALO_03886 [Acetonema longum DSM 6540]|uniref:Nitrate reductase gamma subunit n=2 Tax=Acetonema TaxID=2373 RepID=F7NFF0_9FIRM|nr:hypothetical protein ALO_03886 [Acetonema longum DSM 6540]